MTDMPRDGPYRSAEDPLERILQDRWDRDGADVQRTSVDTTGASHALDPEITSYMLRQAASDPIKQQSLRRIVYEQGYGRPMDRLSTVDLPDLLGKWLTEGRPGLADLEQREYPTSARGIGEEPAAPEEAQEPEETLPEIETFWVRFQVVDDETSEPLSDIRLRIRAPGRGSQEYTTDQQGMIYLDGLSDGVCDIEQMLDDAALEVVRVE